MGEGLVHVRCKTKEELKSIKQGFEKSGMVVNECDMYKPVWH